MSAPAYYAPGHTYSCHCRECMDYKNRYQKHLRVLRAGGTPKVVDATGTRRRLQALAVMGWPVTVISERTGLTRETVTQVTIRGRASVLAETAQAVAGLFRSVGMIPGPHKATTTLALRRGWVGPLAWDDIDNPSESPKGARL